MAEEPMWQHKQYISNWALHKLYTQNEQEQLITYRKDETSMWKNRTTLVKKFYEWMINKEEGL